MRLPKNIRDQNDQVVRVEIDTAVIRQQKSALGIGHIEQLFCIVNLPIGFRNDTGLKRVCY